MPLEHESSPDSFFLQSESHPLISNRAYSTRQGFHENNVLAVREMMFLKGHFASTFARLCIWSLVSLSGIVPNF